MKPARIDWLHRTNEQFAFRVLLVNSDGTPFDLSVYSGLDMQVKADRFQPEPDLELTLSSGLALESGGSNGAIDGSAAVAEIADMIGSYAYDIRASGAGGVSDVVLEGTIQFIQGVTD